MAMHELPELIEGQPPETLVLTGDDRDTWEAVLPLLEPIYRWVDKGGLRMVRWRMTEEVRRQLGIDANARCAVPGCECGNVGLLHCEEHDNWMLDTNWHQTGWCFM